MSAPNSNLLSKGLWQGVSNPTPMSAPDWDSLPTELWQGISTYLPMSDLKDLRQVSKTIESDTRRPYLHRCCPNVSVYLLVDRKGGLFKHSMVAEGVQTLSITQQPWRGEGLYDVKRLLWEGQFDDHVISRKRNASAVAATLTGRELADLIASMPNVRKLTLADFDDAVLQRLLPAVAENAAAQNIKELTVLARVGTINFATLVSVLKTFSHLEALTLADLRLAGDQQSIFACIHGLGLIRLSCSNWHKANGSWVILGVEGEGRALEKIQKFWRNGSIQQYFRQGGSLMAHGSDAVKASVAPFAGRQHPHASMGED